MPDLSAQGTVDLTSAPRSWIDSSESTTYEETTTVDGIVAVGVSSESGNPATVTVTVSGPTGREVVTKTVESPDTETIAIPSGHKVHVTYTGGDRCHARVDWTPHG